VGRRDTLIKLAFDLRKGSVRLKASGASSTPPGAGAGGAPRHHRWRRGLAVRLAEGRPVVRAGGRGLQANRELCGFQLLS